MKNYFKTDRVSRASAVNHANCLSPQEIRLSALSIIFDFMPKGAELSRRGLDDSIFPAAQHIADWIATGEVKRSTEGA